ncbi:MAG: ParB/RepB/Spo0J family partition protein [Planctomycetota bacterium]
MVDRKLGRGLDFFLSPTSRGVTPPPAKVDDQRAKPEAPALDKPAATATAASTQAPPQAPAPAAQAVSPTVPGSEMRLVPVDRIQANPHQPRTSIQDGDLGELADSIRESGVLQPILVRARGGAFEIVAGERRWRAAKLAGLAEVPVVVRAITDQESAVFALVENVQREDLNAMEKAQAFRELQKQLQVSQEEIAKKVGLERSTVANFVRLLDLTPAVQEHVSRGTLSMGHARALLAIKDKDVQVRLADAVIRQGMSVRALEELIRQQATAAPLAAAPSKQTKAQAKAAWLKEIEECLTETLSTTTTVRYGRKASVIQITCAGREEFERIYARLKNC